MQRNPDLIRTILHQIEQHPKPFGPVQFEITEHTPEEISYHLMLLSEAGLIDADDESAYGEHFEWSANRLTWRGHEFLNAAKNDENWSKVKLALNRTGGVVLSIAEQLLLDLVKIQASKILS